MKNQRGPYYWHGAQYTLNRNVKGEWDLTDVTGRVLVTFVCRKLHQHYETGQWVYGWRLQNGTRLANDDRGAVNRWLDEHAAEAAA